MATLLEVLGVSDVRDWEPAPAPRMYRDPNFPQYAVLSFNGKAAAFDPDTGLPVEGQTAVGFAYDTTAEDPDFYILNGAHDVIPLIKGMDFSSLKQGLGLPIMTQAEVDASAAYFGRVLWNSDTGELQFSDTNSDWQEISHTPA